MTLPAAEETIALPPRWSLTRLKHVASLVAGGTPDTEDQDNWLDGEDPSGIRWVSIGDMSRCEVVRSTTKAITHTAAEGRRLRPHPAGTVLLAMYASVGELAVLGTPAIWNQAIVGLVANPTRLSSQFLYFALHTVRTELLAQVRSATQANLNAGQVGDAYLRLPPLDEQRAIADYLDRETAKIDTLISKQEQLIGRLDERRSATRDGTLNQLDWFVPLGSVLGLVQSGPFGSQLSADEYVEGGTPVVNPSHLVGGRVVPDPKVAVSSIKAAELKRHAMRPGDLVVARRGELGRCGLVDGDTAGFLCGTGSALLRPLTHRIDPSYLRLLFGSGRNRDALEQASVGSTMDNVNAKIIARLRVPIPSVEEQRRLEGTVAARVRDIDVLIEKSRGLIELSRERRAALITAAVTGQIDVRDLVA